jgi:hypothetical protein
MQGSMMAKTITDNSVVATIIKITEILLDKHITLLSTELPLINHQHQITLGSNFVVIVILRTKFHIKHPRSVGFTQLVCVDYSLLYWKRKWNDGSSVDVTILPLSGTRKVVVKSHIHFGLEGKKAFESFYSNPGARVQMRVAPVPPRTDPQFRARKLGAKIRGKRGGAHL